MPRRPRSRIPQRVWNTAGTIFVWLIIVGLVLRALIIVAVSLAALWAAVAVIGVISRWLSRPTVGTATQAEERLREF
jgi:hypothetical protein